MKKIKGISLSISDEEVSYNPGYIIRDSPFILIQEFVDGNSSLRDEIINLIKKLFTNYVKSPSRLAAQRQINPE